MRNKIFGVIGMVWGGLIVLRILLNLSALAVRLTPVER